MKAIVIVPSDKGGTLECRDVPEPKPQPGQLLIRVRATALNRADLSQRQGRYPTSATGSAQAVTIAGLEAAGEVAEVGAGVTSFQPGDRVFPLQEALAAQDYLASNAQIGKVILTV